MVKKILVISVLLLGMLLTSCSAVDTLLPIDLDNLTNTQNEVQPDEQEAVVVTEAAPSQPVVVDTGLLAAYENALTEIYDGVSPSVVSIRVVTKVQGMQYNFDSELPFQMPDTPENPQGKREYYSEGQGSGFVWDLDGHIVTNHHVVTGADKIEVMFYDGTIVPAELVGSDANSDLAVIKVDVSPDFLQPVQVADSDEVKVGQLAIAIGNPYGLENTMTVGIVSALGRTIPTTETSTGTSGGYYSIPDIIQTDAPINPGNSGGVLVNNLGQVIGVTAAIESTSGSNAGIGYAIPANIVTRVVPGLIEDGSYQHPYLGISGMSLTPDLAEGMDLPAEQRGALVIEVTPDGPADEAGLRGSDQQFVLEGQTYLIGGDVVTAMNGEPVKEMDDLIAYLFSHTEVGQQVTLSIIRDGKASEIEVVLGARPGTQTEPQQVSLDEESGAYLGIVGRTVTAAIAESMDLPEDQSGVLIQQVIAGGPADEAGLRGSYKPVMIDGEEVLVGGDVITAFGGEAVKTIQELAAFLKEAQPEQTVNLTILRDGKTERVRVTLSAPSDD